MQQQSRKHGTALHSPLLRMCCAVWVTVNIDLSPSAIAMIDTAYLGLLSVYGQFPRSVKSLLFTGLVYGLPAVLRFAGMEDQLPAIQHFPKYASRLGMAYSAISTLAILLVALACIPICYKLMQSDAVQDAVHSAVDGAKPTRQPGVGVSAGKGVGGTGENGRGYDAGEEADDDDDDEDEDDTEPLTRQPQARSTRTGKVAQ